MDLHHTITEAAKVPRQGQVNRGKKGHRYRLYRQTVFLSDGEENCMFVHSMNNQHIKLISPDQKTGKTER